jgi:uncharacterized protein (DUF924 family)
MLESALRGELDGWGGTPHGALALIVVLDQFSRNIHRDTPRAFEGDAAALVLAAKLVDGGGDRALVPVERWFAYMPFEHSESLLPVQSIRLFEELAQAGSKPRCRGRASTSTRSGALPLFRTGTTSSAAEHPSAAGTGSSAAGIPLESGDET